MNVIPLAKCKHGIVYELASRNLIAGVFVKEREGFIGIREKFGSRFLFMEFHYDTGAPFGTVRPLKELTRVPDNIPLAEHLETLDEVTKKLVEFDRPVSDGGKGWFFVDSGEASDKIHPVAIPNKKLFRFLEKLERAIKVKCKKCKHSFTPSRRSKNGSCPFCAMSASPTQES